MKQLILIFLLPFAFLHVSAQYKIGQKVENLSIQTLLNAPVKHSNLTALKGKVVVIEFWATWCAPCIEAMPHLKALQRQYKTQLQVITVSDEKVSRVQQFIHNSPSNLWFAIDSAHAISQAFPFRIIPHTVVIDKNGIVAAITQPENITSDVIASVIAGEQLNLPVKEDNLTNNPWDTYFHADTTTKSRFLIEPQIQGLSSSKKAYNFDHAFSGRRITLINLGLKAIYCTAYGDISYGRTADSVAEQNKEECKRHYCVDIIVPRGQERDLLNTLKNELQSRFELKAVLEKQSRPVYVLAIADPQKIAKLQSSILNKPVWNGSSGSFEGRGVQFSLIANYLESSGVVNLPVVDETGSHTSYDIKFTYLPEKKGDIENTLQSMGLKLTRTERMIDILVFR